MIPEPSIYKGTLRHRRFGPKPHAFRYSLFMALVDIDRIPETMARCAVTSYNRFNWASFDERDHFGDPAAPLRERLEQDAKANSVPMPDGPVFLLTHLRYLGYCFNPISFFYCFDKAGRLPVVMAEVHNTFGESRNYWLWEGNRRPAENSLRFQCEKSLHVSPFFGMNMDYDFVLTAPEEKLVAHMNTTEGGEKKLDATLTLERHPWRASTLTGALLAQPAMTAKVTLAIHWEALRLLVKGVPVFTHPDRIPKATTTEGTRP